MKTREITQVMYGSGYAGSGVVEFKIGEEWYNLELSLISFCASLYE